MSTQPDFDLLLTAWLEEGPTEPSTGIVDEALRKARAMPQRRNRLALVWQGLHGSPRLQRPSVRVAIILVGLALLLVVAATIAGVGAPRPPQLKLSSTPPPINLSVVAPQKPAPPAGLARTGLLAFDSNGQVFVANADGTALNPLTVSGSTNSAPAWSPDGTRLAFWSQSTAGAFVGGGQSPSAQLRIYDAGRAQLIDVTGPHDPSRLGPEARIPSVSWSPDGKLLAFSASVGGVARIVVVHADGSGETAIGDPSLAARSPVWSPDGGRLAFGGGSGASSGVYVMNAEGTGVRRVSTAPGTGLAFELPQWSPDSARIAYVAGDDSAHDVWMAGADGSGERNLSNDPLDELWPAWSPDGTHIAFDRSISGIASSYQVVVANADGSAQVALESPATDGSPLDWSPDGTKIATRYLGFASVGVSGATNLLVLDVSGKAAPIVVPVNGWSGVGSWQRLAP